MDTIVAVARAQMEALDAKRAKLAKIIELAESMDEPASPKVRVESAKPPVRGPATTTKETWDAARAILQERAKPVRLRDLLDGVRERGVDVGGKQPASTLAARLSNSKEFKSHRGIGWWFADKPLPNGRTEFDEVDGAQRQEPGASAMETADAPYENEAATDASETDAGSVQSASGVLPLNQSHRGT